MLANRYHQPARSIVVQLDCIGTKTGSLESTSRHHQTGRMTFQSKATTAAWSPTDWVSPQVATRFALGPSQMNPYHVEHCGTRILVGHKWYYNLVMVVSKALIPVLRSNMHNRSDREGQGEPKSLST